MAFDSPALHPEGVPACAHCQAGSLHLQRVVYARWYAGHFLTIPNFPSWVCDICGSREYDVAALEQVRLLLGRESAARTEAARRAGHTPAHARSHSRSSGRRPI